MITRPCSDALGWWLNNQGKLDGSSVSTKEISSTEYQITKWVVSGVTQPTDQEVEVIIDDYNTWIVKQPTYITLISPDQSKWTVNVDNLGILTTKKVT